MKKSKTIDFDRYDEIREQDGVTERKVYEGPGFESWYLYRNGDIIAGAEVSWDDEHFYCYEEENQ